MSKHEQGVCEVVAAELPDPLRRICDKPAVLRYAAMGGGYMRLCAEHGDKHKRYCEAWVGDHWEPTDELWAQRDTKVSQ